MARMADLERRFEMWVLKLTRSRLRVSNAKVSCSSLASVLTRVPRKGSESHVLPSSVERCLQVEVQEAGGADELFGIRWGWIF